MARISAQPKISLELTFTVSESEARALDALAGYGDDAFIEKFKASLGSYYMQDHEQGLREFLRSIRDIASVHIRALDKARKAFVEQ